MDKVRGKKWFIWIFLSKNYRVYIFVNMDGVRGRSGLFECFYRKIMVYISPYITRAKGIYSNPFDEKLHYIYLHICIDGVRGKKGLFEPFQWKINIPHQHRRS